jgi:hypothetical protein
MVARRDRECIDVQLWSIGEGIGLEIPPDVFDGVEFGRIGREVFDREVRLGSKIAGHDARPMHVEPVPEDEGATAKMER